MNVIIIDVDKDLTHLAGREFAARIYKEQIAKKITRMGLNILVFPEHVKFLSKSFSDTLNSILDVALLDNTELFFLNPKFDVKVKGLSIEEAVLKEGILRVCPACKNTDKLSKFIINNNDIYACGNCNGIMFLGLFNNSTKVLLGKAEGEEK